MRASTPGRRSRTPRHAERGPRPSVRGIERQQAPVTGAGEDGALGRWTRSGPQRDAAMRLIAPRRRARLRVVPPLLATRVAVDRDDDAGGRGDVHAPIGKHRARLDARHLAHGSGTPATAEVPAVVGPRRGQPVDVLARDVGERRKPRAVVNRTCSPIGQGTREGGADDHNQQKAGALQPPRAPGAQASA